MNNYPCDICGMYHAVGLNGEEINPCKPIIIDVQIEVVN